MDIERRRLSFGGSADLYERYRPDYPSAAIAWLVGPRPLRVLDVGAGTGKLSRALLAAGHDVVAVEPDPGMRAAFARSVPGAEVLAGSAEQIPVEHATFDAVAAGQSYHWFDEHLALPELARVLRPGGRLGAVWNVRDEAMPWVAELGRVLRGADGTGNYGADEHADSFGPLFGPVERAEFPHVQALDVAGLVGLAASRSYAITLAPPDRERLLAEVERIGRAAEAGGRVSLPYRTVCLRASLRRSID